ncbi:MAG: A/G-specific adenine glycosylase [Chlamydiota bacterium]
MMDLQALRDWFLTNQRDLPWREEHTPYRVWVSEIMLQQTQASVVIPYFLRWMERFPTIKDLADAPLEEVIKLWEGLGYYSRARNLHEGAKKIINHFGGVFPSKTEDLQSIKGIGPYTIGAIQSFAFHKKSPAVDGNVIRVITRLLGISDDMAKAKHQKMLQQKVFDLLPDYEPWVISEALIELGATVCKKKAFCRDCPMNTQCYANLHGEVEKYPVKTKNVQYTTLHRSVAVILNDQSILLQQGAKGEVMEGLYEFPYFEHSTENCITYDVHQILSLNTLVVKTLERELHIFTRYRVHLYPVLLKACEKFTPPGYCWHSLDNVYSLPFSSGHRRVLVSAQPDLCRS